MKLLLDQDVYFATQRFLREIGHEVVTASELGLSRAEDADLLRRAKELGRILVTRDRDFGRLVLLERLRHGVLYLRIRPSELSVGHEELRNVLDSYSEPELRSALVVVEAGRHRIRRFGSEDK
ncbi:MAG: hypothetical protein GY719_13065 [bacterium]|nr:hypothetical protein [bacterium]